MSAFRSHYDVLGVARSASDEVIRAAYRVLTQKYHPDHNPHQQQQAHQAMTELNEAYAVLSDHNKRWEYDLWLQRRQLQAQVSSHALMRQQNSAAQHMPVSAPPPLLIGGDTVTLPTRHHGWIWFLVVAVALVMGGIWWKMMQPAPVPAPLAMVTQAPNGYAFPVEAGYVTGYPVLHERGGNVIRVDNSGSSTAVFVQLYELSRNQFTAIRSFYLPAGGAFNLRKIGDGDFSLHYQRLDNGSWQVSDAIQISHTERSRQYRNIDIHL